MPAIPPQIKGIRYLTFTSHHSTKGFSASINTNGEELLLPSKSRQQHNLCSDTLFRNLHSNSHLKRLNMSGHGGRGGRGGRGSRGGRGERGWRGGRGPGRGRGRGGNSFSNHDGNPQHESKPIRTKETDEQREARKSYSSWKRRLGEAETDPTTMRRLW